MPFSVFFWNSSCTRHTRSWPIQFANIPRRVKKKKGVYDEASGGGNTRWGRARGHSSYRVSVRGTESRALKSEHVLTRSSREVLESLGANDERATRQRFLFSFFLSTHLTSRGAGLGPKDCFFCPRSHIYADFLVLFLYVRNRDVIYHTMLMALKELKRQLFLPRNACRFSSLVYLTHLYVSFESRSSYHGHDLVLGLFAKLLFPCPDGANTQRVNSWVLLFMVCFFICGFYFVKAFTPGLLSFLFSGTFFFLTVETWKIPPLNVTRKESFIRSFYRFCILLFETEPVSFF